MKLKNIVGSITEVTDGSVVIPYPDKKVIYHVDISKLECSFNLGDTIAVVGTPMASAPTMKETEEWTLVWLDAIAAGKRLF